MADPCVQLAQRLAGNEKKSRDRALRRLRAYLRERSREGEMTAEEFGKIWKGLFYCLWMQDKPLLQEELAQHMAQLVHMLQTDQSRNLFLRSFWQTLNREWNGIDRLRLDKFYTLTRCVLHQSGQLMRQAEWAESAVEGFLTVLVEEVLKAEAPRGVQHHLIDIYLEELAKIGSAELTAEMNLKLIEPFCKIAAKTKDPVLHQSVVGGIFEAILDQAPFAIEDLMKELGHQPTDDGGDVSGDRLSRDTEDIGPVLQFDYQAVSERLFGLGSRQNIPTRNRKSLYRLVKRFKDLAEGVFPQDEFPEEVSTDEDDDEFSSWRFRKRQKKFQERAMMETQGFIDEPEKKKRRQAAPMSAEPQEAAGEVGGPPAKRKRKKRRATERPLLNGSAESPPTKEHTAKGAPPTTTDTTTAKAALPKTAKAAPPTTTDTTTTKAAPPTTTDTTTAKAAPPKTAKAAPPTTTDTTTTKAAPPTTAKADLPTTTKASVKRRRSRLLRLSLSVMPLRGALMMRRRRALGRSRQMISKAETSSSPVSVARVSVVPATPPAKVSSVAQDFVAFRKLETPKPLYVKNAKIGGRQIRKDQNCNSSKKVTFSLNKNMTAEFKRTDRSLLVSPAGSSRIPFNPDQRPQHGVLKTPSPRSRPRASDFF